MNQNLIKVIAQYLAIETSYAVILSGEYGIGKTYFFKEVLSPEIKKVVVHNLDGKITFIPIHISLFGLKSIEEIQTEIFLSIYSIPRSKNFVLAGSILKTLARGIAGITKAGDIDKFIDDVRKGAVEQIDYNRLLLCLDDFDRISPQLNMREVLGFVNSLVENHGAKVIIIANETILSKDTEYISTLKEKVIGVTINYIPETSNVIENIINSKYSTENITYHTFLQNNLAKIKEISELNKNNFRNLIFFLEHFRYIFNSIELLFQADKNFRKNKEAKQKAIFDFSIAIAIEYKAGRLNIENAKKIHELSNRVYLANYKEDEEKAYLEKLNKEYFSNDTYYFFRSILDYIIGYSDFESQKLKDELDNYFNLIEKNNIIDLSILELLNYRNYYKLTDVEYKKNTRELLNLAESGNLPLTQYSTIFHYCVRFNNLLNYNIPNLKKRIKKGIDKGSKKFKYIEDLQHYLQVSVNTEFKEDTIEIIRYCLHTNELILEKEANEQIEDFKKLLHIDSNSFIKKISDNDFEFRFKEFWNRFSPNVLYRVLNKLSNEQILKLNEHFSNRYKKNIFDGIYSEKAFVTKLKQLIDKPTKIRAKKNLRNTALNSLSNSLNEAINNFPAD